MKLRVLVLTSLLASAPAFAASSAHSGPFGWLMDPVTNTAFAAMVAFFIVVWRVGGFKTIFGALDKRAEAIASELEQARNLREEAAKALASAERAQAEADKEAEAIVEQAKKDADAMMEDARKELADRLARREASAEQRISRAAQEAEEEVRRAAADAATAAAKALLSKDGDYFETAASEIEKALS